MWLANGWFYDWISCNAAGDLRIFYTVQDPMIICPILGYVRNVGTISNKWWTIVPIPWCSNDHDIGIVHEGMIHTVQEMIVAEDCSSL